MSDSIVLSALGARDDAEAILKVRGLDAVFAEASAVVGTSGTPDQIVGALRALKLRADKADDYKAKLDEIEKQQADDKKDALIAKLAEDGKLPPAMHAWAKSVSLSVLEGFGESATVVAKTDAVKAAKTDTDKVVLTDDDKHVASLLGIPEKDFDVSDRQRSDAA